MADDEVIPRRSLEFAESSVLEAVVPASSDIDIKSEIDSWDGAADDNGSILPFLAQRNVLLLGTSPTIPYNQHVSYSCTGL